MLRLRAALRLAKRNATGWGQPAALRAPVSTAAVANPPLVRDFIRAALCDPAAGYFAARPSSVGILPAPINFRGLLGEREYRKRLAESYKALDVSWLTPAELFSPWYGAALADYMLAEAEADGTLSSGLRIVEIGPGAGTAARDVLLRLRSKAPAAFAATEYHALEASPALAAGLESRASTWPPALRRRLRVTVGDGAAVGDWGGVDARPCFVLMLEVLDNLPHDVVRRERPGAPWLEARVAAPPGWGGYPQALFPGDAKDSISESVREVLVPTSDGQLTACLRHWEALNGAESLDESVTQSESVTESQTQSEFGTQASRASLWSRAAAALSWNFNRRGNADGRDGPLSVWLPTGAAAAFGAMHASRPAHRLIAADFNSLPEVTLAGVGAPLVASQAPGGVTVDHSTFLVPCGSADIFFPCDFGLLSRLHAAAGGGGGRGGRVMKSAEFLGRHGEPGRAATLSGYNPLLEDFSNTSFLLT